MSPTDRSQVEKGEVVIDGRTIALAKENADEVELCLFSHVSLIE